MIISLNCGWKHINPHVFGGGAETNIIKYFCFFQSTKLDDVNWKTYKLACLWRYYQISDMYRYDYISSNMTTVMIRYEHI